MLQFSSALAADLLTAVSKDEWCSKIATALGATRSVVIKHAATEEDVWGTGTVILDAALIGSMSVVNHELTNFGSVGAAVTQLAQDLSTGFAVMRIQGEGGSWFQGSFGLEGSGRDFRVRASPAANTGYGFVASCKLRAPSSLPDVSPGEVLTTLTLVNESGSATPSEFFPRMFGLPLKQGDMPAGEWPVFGLTDGTPCAASMDQATYWPDGSMRFVPVLLRVPTSIAGSGSITVNVKNGGSAPVASSVTASTLTSASDLKVSLNALRNWTAGEWVSAVNQGITDGDVWTFINGPAGRVLRVYEGFRQSGADHGQAGVWHYIQVLQNSSGGLYGLRHLGKFANGWHDVTSPQINTLVADACALKNGTTTIRNITPSASARTFSWSSGFAAANVTGLVSGMPVRLTTTGTLPAGLSSTTAYFVRLTGGNGFTLHPSIGDVVYNTNVVAASDAGSGTHTLTPVFHMETYAAGPYTAGSGTQFDFIQAGARAQNVPCQSGLTRNT